MESSTSGTGELLTSICPEALPSPARSAAQRLRSVSWDRNRRRGKTDGRDRHSHGPEADCAYIRAEIWHPTRSICHNRTAVEVAADLDLDMVVSGTHFRTIWMTESGAVRVIDQTRLPFEFATIDLETLADAARAISTMVVRGAPLIGATAAYGLALAVRSNPSDAYLTEAARTLQATRPTAINLGWALTRMRTVLADVQPQERADAAFREAAAI